MNEISGNFGMDDYAQRLRSAIDALDPVIALLALVHLTGDRTLLASHGPALEGVPRAGGSSFSAKVEQGNKEPDPTVVADIRARLLAAMESDSDPVLTSLDRALFKQMAEFCLDRDLTEDALAMGREAAGFAIGEGGIEATKVPPEDFEVLIVGAGMMGIIAAIRLKAAGFRYRVIERNTGVGGTWFVNTYPNVAVDTPSVEYSISFAQNSSWSKYYPRGGEYREYLDGVARKFRIFDQIDFETEFNGCSWDDAAKQWVVSTTRGGEEVTYRAKALVMALGFLTRPSFPDVEGLDRFKGPVVHGGYWDDSVDLAGKKIVVVGTGASSAQISTGLADRASHLTVVQRQPNYMMPDPRVLQEVEPNELWALKHIPFVTQWQRLQWFSSMMTRTATPAQIDPEFRARTGGVSQMNEAARQVSIGYMERKFADRPDLMEKVRPDFPFFSKRPILDCGYYDTLMRPDVDLVQGEMVRCEEDAIVLSDGTRIECDALVLATGYTLEYFVDFSITGRNGVDLQDLWNPVPYAYKGMEVPGFPNMFITAGPNSGLASSHTVLAEQQVHYIVEALKRMVEDDLATIEVTEQACRDFNDMLQERLENTIWMQSGTAHGYYRHHTGKIVLAFPGPNVEYWKMLRRPDMADYRIEEKAPADAPALAAAD
jgi:cation diffusion facilitator CzcD-associated flavoprotein CzcO